MQNPYDSSSYLYTQTGDTVASGGYPVSTPQHATTLDTFDGSRLGTAPLTAGSSDSADPRSTMYPPPMPTYDHEAGGASASHPYSRNLYQGYQHSLNSTSPAQIKCDAHKQASIVLEFSQALSKLNLHIKTIQDPALASKVLESNISSQLEAISKVLSACPTPQRVETWNDVSIQSNVKTKEEIDQLKHAAKVFQPEGPMAALLHHAMTCRLPIAMFNLSLRFSAGHLSPSLVSYDVWAEQTAQLKARQAQSSGQTASHNAALIDTHATLGDSYTYLTPQNDWYVPLSGTPMYSQQLSNETYGPMTPFPSTARGAPHVVEDVTDNV